MKTTFVLCALAVLAVSNAEDVVKAPVSGANLADDDVIKAPVSSANLPDEDVVKAPVSSANQADDDEVKAPVSRANLDQGHISNGDRLLTRQYLYKQEMYNTVQYQDLFYRGNRNTRISAIRAFEVGGYSQFASAWVSSGGIGRNNANVRVQSARGYGFNYRVEIWGR